MSNILCTICARGGSKGVKNKNIKELNGKPLKEHYIRFDDIVNWGLLELYMTATPSK